MEQLENMETVRVGGRYVNWIRYANDKILIADSNEKHQEMTAVLDEASNSSF